MNASSFVTDKNGKSVLPHYDGISRKMVAGAIKEVEMGDVVWYLPDIPDLWVDAAALGSGDVREEMKSLLGKDAVSGGEVVSWIVEEEDP